MTEPEIYAALTEIFHDVFMRDDLVLTPTLTAKDVPGWDSFKQIEIVIATEEKFGMKFHTRELDRLQNVGDLVAVVVAKFLLTPPAAQSSSKAPAALSGLPETPRASGSSPSKPRTCAPRVCSCTGVPPRSPPPHPWAAAHR